MTSCRNRKGGFLSSFSESFGLCTILFGPCRIFTVSSQKLCSMLSKPPATSSPNQTHKIPKMKMKKVRHSVRLLGRRKGKTTETHACVGGGTKPLAKPGGGRLRGRPKHPHRGTNRCRSGPPLEISPLFKKIQKKRNQNDRSTIR